MKVLVIDDDNFIISVFESEFHQNNIQVEKAQNGQEALEKAAKCEPDLICMELILTRKNGFEVLEELKKNEKTKDTPVVIYSSLNQKDDVQEALAKGATKYFPKEEYSVKQIIKEIMNILISL
jgi:CheY-like chemotaxis protein